MSLTRSLKALADERRLQILILLNAGDLCVGALARQLGISKPAVSQHLQVLRKAGLVKGEKRGYWTHYVVQRDALAQVAAALQALSEGERRPVSICWRIDSAPTAPLPERPTPCAAKAAP